MNIIQDYMNRANLTEGRVNDLKNSLSKNENENSLKSDFKQILDENLIGKIATSDVKAKNNIKDEIKQDPYRKKLFDASVEFESMFVKLMLNQMRKSVEKNNMISGGYAEEIFEDMLYDEYAKNISKNESLGIAEQIYSSMSKSLPPLQGDSQK